jgi:hypothetical protein
MNSKGLKPLENTEMALLIINLVYMTTRTNELEHEQPVKPSLFLSALLIIGALLMLLGLFVSLQYRDELALFELGGSAFSSKLSGMIIMFVGTAMTYFASSRCPDNSTIFDSTLNILHCKSTFTKTFLVLAIALLVAIVMNVV